MTHELWARAILAMGAVIVVPLGMRLADHTFPSRAAVRLRPIISVLLVPAALLLSAAQLWSPGGIAVLLTLPWLLATGLIAVVGLLRVWQARRGPLAEVAVAAGMTFLAVGSGWAVLDRAGVRPLEFDPAIVLLTGIHFHYAGFALPILAGLASRRLAGLGSERQYQRLSIFGVLFSVPLVAVGITASQLGYPAWMELVAAWFMSISGLSVAWLYLRLAFDPRTRRISRELWGGGSLLLACGMVLALVYGSRSLLGPMWLDIPWMIALHGSSNALGFVIPCLIGWRLQIGAESSWN